MSPTLLLVFGIPLTVVGVVCNVAIRSLVRQQRQGTLEGILDRIEGTNFMEGFGELEHPGKWGLLAGSALFLPGFAMVVLGFFRL